MVSDTSSPQVVATNVTLKRMKVTNNEKCTFCNTHNETIPYLFRSCDIVHRFWLMFETFVNEKCLNMINMKLTEDFVLFGNAKDFESDEIFDFIILFVKFFLYTNGKWKINAHFFMYFKNNWQQGVKQKNIYHMSTWSMPHFGQNGFVICPLFRTMAKFDCMTISTSSHHVYIVMDANEHVML